MIFSIEFMVLFSVQYFIILLNLKNWQWEIYGFFALSIVAAWWYAKKEQKRYKKNAKEFDVLYTKTQTLINSLSINKKDYLIGESDEHI
jgi:membrane protein implicated in regulation of membrane protease activity